MKLRRTSVAALAVAVVAAAVAGSAFAANVKITPLGSHTGEFCLLDRALVLEDPNGTRLLYDPGRTVAGPMDPRLGPIDAILVSHLHGDHVGDTRIAQVDDELGDCGNPNTAAVNTTEFTGAVDIALGKGAQIVTGSEMPFFFANKLDKAGGNPGASRLVRFGASVDVGGVTITTVPAVHSNGINAAFIDGELGDLLAAAGLTAYAGPPTGYVLTFTNGLVVYLSGDTGVTAEQETVVRKQYGAKLVVINIGDTFTTGPTEAAFVINKLIKPRSVIASHANERATLDGEVLPGTKTATFIDATRAPVHLPLSGRTMIFDDKGMCVGGC